MSDADQIKGMTVNERLFHFQLFESFELAVKCRNEATIVEILKQAQLSDLQSSETAKAILANPCKYGF